MSRSMHTLSMVFVRISLAACRHDTIKYPVIRPVQSVSVATCRRVPYEPIYKSQGCRFKSYSGSQNLR
jgi:hypothetical protein